VPRSDFWLDRNDSYKRDRKMKFHCRSRILWKGNIRHAFSNWWRRNSKRMCPWLGLTKKWSRRECSSLIKQRRSMIWTWRGRLIWTPTKCIDNKTCTPKCKKSRRERIRNWNNKCEVKHMNRNQETSKPCSKTATRKNTNHRCKAASASIRLGFRNSTTKKAKTRWYRNC